MIVSYASSVSDNTGNTALNCSYLAELINPDFKLFFVDLYAIQLLEFEPWPNPIELPVIIKTDSHAIFLAKLEILRADEMEDRFVEIICNRYWNRNNLQ